MGGFKPHHTQTDSSVANMLATTFSVGNSNVDVMCMFSTGQQFTTLFVYISGISKIGRPTVGRWVDAKYLSADKLLATKSRYVYGGL